MNWQIPEKLSINYQYICQHVTNSSQQADICWFAHIDHGFICIFAV